MSALSIGWAGVLMFVLQDRSTGSASLFGLGPLAIWAVALLVGSAGLGLAGGTPPPADRLVLNTMLLLGSALSWTAARVFGERQPRLGAVVAGPLGWVIATLALSTYADVGAHAVWSACGVGAAYTAATFRELWRCRDEALPALPVALILMGVHILIYTARAVSNLVPTAPDTEALVQVALVIEGMLHTVGMGFVLLALTAERAAIRATAGLRQQAMVDGLTGLANRRHFDTHLEQEHRRYARHNSPLSLVLIDADQFKRFNDRYGHVEGDTCLRNIAACVGQFANRPGDLAARFGGEEFAILLPGTDLMGAAAVADNVRVAILNLNMPHADGVDGRVSVSLGVAAWPGGPGFVTIDALVRDADQALYRAKAAGRAVVRVTHSAPGPLRSAVLARARQA